MKKTIRFILCMLLIVVVLAATTACGSKKTSDSSAPAPAPEPEKKIEIKIGHDSAQETPAHQALLEFEKNVEQKSNGRITVSIFPNSQLGTFQDLFDQTRSGDIQMALTASVNLSPTIPEFAVWDSFFLFDDVQHARRVLDGKAGQELLKPLEKMNLVGLGYMENGFRNFSNSKRPIQKVEDIKGLKIRGYNPIQMKAWESLGANLTNLAWAEVFSSLQQKLIDGQECATTSFVTSKFYETQKYWSLTNHTFTNYIWYANSKFMNELSAEDRKLIEDESKATIGIQRDLMDKREKDLLEKLPSLGTTVNEVSVEERHKMGETMNNAVKDQIIEKCGQQLYDLVINEVKAERK